MLILLIALLSTATIEQLLVQEVTAKNGSHVAVKLLPERNGSGTATQLVLRLENRGPSAVMLPRLVSNYHFLNVAGVPWKSGDLISEPPRYNVYGNGYVELRRGGSLRHEISISDLLGPRWKTDGSYLLKLTYDDAWSEFPTLGSVPLGSVLITKNGDHLSASLRRKS